ncbi:MAG: sodium:solute symporter family protein [Acidimicrobiia bacterium]|nr:sodium:solute symporter family protein [Acidimicrobiia bacterium]
MVQLHWFDVVVLAGYFVAVVCVGLLAQRRIKNMDDYYLGGRRFGKAFMTMYAFGAGTHADSAVGLAAQTYKLGMAGIWYQWCQIFNTPFYWLLSPIFRRARCLTTGDIYEMRYGRSLGILYGFWGVAINVGYFGVTLFGSARLIEALTAGKITVFWAVLLMIGACVFYSLVGGMIATIWNEFLQGMMTIVMSFLLLPFLWWAVGGIPGVKASVANADSLFRMVAPGQIGLFWIILVSLNQVVGFPSAPHIFSNNAAGRTELDNRIGFCAGVTLKRLCSIGWAFAGVLAVAYYGAGKIEPDHIFGSLIRDILPVGFAGLMLACIMASVMDNGAVFVLTSSALFTRNLLRTFKAEERTRLELRVSRWFSFLFVCASVGLALSFDNVPSAIRFMWALTPMLGIAFWLGLWWRRANRYGAWASFLAATLAWWLGINAFGWRGDTGLPYVMSFYILAGVGAGAIVSLLTRPEPQQALDRFFLTINTPIGQEARLQRFEAQQPAAVEAS